MVWREPGGVGIIGFGGLGAEVPEGLCFAEMREIPIFGKLR